ncbi:3'-5' exonuclease domain-containing protein [Cavenderia fasciculata]|uniref:3'-5' exonuclease domain-containing protein n=1 Tax=Cavenderia fasciculata TaxID=261658 RepID=F4PSZ1_CACFS|nr:3'-5' exonuclease domain-containing protein [Cavenderia fasciculata]EGG20780.1 3'-5' exonuclease domain-containing protein [Cavenderia fasciculata]|eukprot:XP_004358630.1 3'-5' exonuclease domain-containing protein [Cavenderia fasciculata]
MELLPKRPSTYVFGGMIALSLYLKYLENKSNKESSSNISDSSNSNTLERIKKDYYKLPTNLKIHIINDVDQCDRLLLKLYEDVIRNIEQLDFEEQQEKELEKLMNGSQEDDESSSSSSTIKIISPEQCKVDMKHLEQHQIDKKKEKREKMLERVLGLDAEWGNSKSMAEASLRESNGIKTNDKVALIQIAFKDEVFLIQCLRLKAIPKSLQLLMADHRILKVGVSIAQDATTIIKHLGIEVKGCVDLVPLGNMTGFDGCGLAALAKSTMGVTIDKSHHIRCGHWESEQLTPDQIHYAACDAWIGREIFNVMYDKHVDTHKTEITPTEFVSPFITSTFKIKNKNGGGGAKSGSSADSPINAKKKSSFATLIPDGRVLYDNCLMFAQDGETLLCNISKKKVEWYLSRNLATKFCDDPIKIKLTFTPKGNGHAEDKYYLSNKTNNCCVCGSGKQLMRHSIVPHSYRQYLPVRVKSHSSHDVVLLCCDCHLHVNRRIHLMRMMIANEYGIEYDTGADSMEIDMQILKLTKQAAVLMHAMYPTSSKKSVQLPANKFEEFKKNVCQHLNKEELTLEDLTNLANQNPRNKRPDYIPHEKRVMDTVISKGDQEIEKFIVKWRQHFVQVTSPKHLNEHWDINKKSFQN